MIVITVDRYHIIQFYNQEQETFLISDTFLLFVVYLIKTCYSMITKFFDYLVNIATSKSLYNYNTIKIRKSRCLFFSLVARCKTLP